MKNLKIVFWCLLLAPLFMNQALAQPIDSLRSESLVPQWKNDLNKIGRYGSKGDRALLNTVNKADPVPYLLQGFTLNSSRKIMGFGMYPQGDFSCPSDRVFSAAIGEVFNSDYVRGYTNSAKFITSEGMNGLNSACCPTASGCYNFSKTSGVSICGRLHQVPTGQQGDVPCKSNGFVGYYHFENTGDFNNPTYLPIQEDQNGEAYLSGSWLWHWVIDDQERTVSGTSVNANNNLIEAIDIVQGDDGFIYIAGNVTTECSPEETYEGRDPYRPFVVKIRNSFTGRPESSHLYTLPENQSFKVNSLRVDDDGALYLVGAYSSDYTNTNLAYTAGIMRINQNAITTSPANQNWQLYTPLVGTDSEAMRIDFASDNGNSYDNIILLGNITRSTPASTDPFVAVFPTLLTSTALVEAKIVDIRGNNFGKAIKVKQVKNVNGVDEHEILISGNHNDWDIFPWKYRIRYSNNSQPSGNHFTIQNNDLVRMYKGQGENHDVYTRYITTGHNVAEGLGFIRHNEEGANFWTAIPVDGEDNCCQNYFDQTALTDVRTTELYDDGYSLEHARMYFYEFGRNIPFTTRTEQCDLSSDCNPTVFEDCTVNPPSAPAPMNGSTTGLEHFESIHAEPSLSIYPNPNEGDVTLMVEVDEAQDLEIALYDLQGKKLETLGSGSFASGSHTLNYSLNAYSNGTYFIRIEGTQWTTSQQVTINK